MREVGGTGRDEANAGEYGTSSRDNKQHSASATEAAAAARRAKYGALPSGVDPADYVVEVPAIPDDRPEAAPPAPAAAPELIAATQVADGQSARGSLADRIARRRHGPTVK
jgi:hypothetical protein